MIKWLKKRFNLIQDEDDPYGDEPKRVLLSHTETSFRINRLIALYNDGTYDEIFTDDVKFDVLHHNISKIEVGNPPDIPIKPVDIKNLIIYTDRLIIEYNVVQVFEAGFIGMSIKFDDVTITTIKANNIKGITLF